MVQWLTSDSLRAPHIEGRQRFYVRLIIGLVQGGSAYGLYRLNEFGKFDSSLLLVWALLTAYAPPVWLAAIGQISMRSTLIWCGIVTAVIAALGLTNGAQGGQETTFAVAVVCLPVALFCAHHLAVPAINHRSLIAPYESYYEAAWKAGIQLVLALMFLGVFWAILWLGAMLFNAIGINAIERFITKPYFVLVATPVFFAIGVELSDVRDGLTQGIRTVALTLLSWLLPIAVLIAGAFLVTLPIAGMSELQSSLSPSGLMLTASAGLILLVNTVYQDGADHLSPTRFLRMTMHVGAVLLVPMTAFALWGVSVRIGQYGLTLPRIIALTGAIIGLLYALGYATGLLVKGRRGGWLPVFEMTNVVVGILTTLTLVAYSTPWLNPVKLAMDSQIARIEGGTLGADEIPYNYLSRQAGERGRSVLGELQKSDDPVIRERATNALNGEYISETSTGINLTLLPEGTILPGSENSRLMLEEAIKRELGTYQCSKNCDARLYDLDADGRDEVVIAQDIGFWVFGLNENGTWSKLGMLARRADCSQDMVKADQLKSDSLAPAASREIKGVALGNMVMDFIPDTHCPSPDIKPAG
ncbi:MULTISPECIES: DUF4153 domain-containing protein [unclassified Brevundimonas]|uniref:DUF4153 domain-containing protein n=1 Tax=unclassified Brevundimonas TaxID=2622653 RepID=UPI0025C14D02|nr:MULTISPECIES: DUF4153 domain-containing protein [unclassified Brevundimonas]